MLPWLVSSILWLMFTKITIKKPFQQSSGTVAWEAEYVLLLWASILVKNPFDLSRFDSGQQVNIVLFYFIFLEYSNLFILRSLY